MKLAVLTIVAAFQHFELSEESVYWSGVLLHHGYHQRRPAVDMELGESQQ